jgi:hypothetical protein
MPSIAGRMLLFPAFAVLAVLVAWRSRRATLLRLMAPFVFLLLALVIQLALDANSRRCARALAGNSLAGQLSVWATCVSTTDRPANSWAKQLLAEATCLAASLTSKSAVA